MGGDNFHNTFLRSLCLSTPPLQNARSTRETYGAVVEVNIFFLTSFSLHTLAFVMFSIEELGLWRCIGSNSR